MRIQPDNVIAVPAKGASFDVIVSDTQEVVATIPLSGGITPARYLMKFQTAGMELSFPSSVSVMAPPSRVAVTRHPEAHSSAVRDGYRPTEATRAAQAMEQLLRASEAKLRREFKKQMAQGGRIAARAEAAVPAPDADDTVIEPVTDASQKV